MRPHCSSESHHDNIQIARHHFHEDVRHLKGHFQPVQNVGVQGHASTDGPRTTIFKPLRHTPLRLSVTLPHLLHVLQETPLAQELLGVIEHRREVREHLLQLHQVLGRQLPRHLLGLDDAPSQPRSRELRHVRL